MAHRSAPLLLKLLLLLSLLLSFTVSQGEQQQQSRTIRLHFKFSVEESQTVVEYKDPHYGYVKLAVPAFLRGYSGDRIAQELTYYLGAGQRWSQRMLLEILYYSLTYGEDHKPAQEDTPAHSSPSSCLEGMTHWLDESMDPCKWEGVICGIFRPLQEERPRVELEYMVDASDNHDWTSYKTTASWDHPYSPHHVVTQLSFANLNCQGTLPEELYMFSELRRLSFRKNALHGTIPATYGELHKLEFLDLSYNRLEGVPWHLSHSLGKNLQELWLGHNMLAGPLHFYLQHMNRLTYFDVSSNIISGSIPTQIESFSLLKGLFLEHNAIEGLLITQLGALQVLEQLHLQNNTLTGSIPTEFGNMSNLKHLLINDNIINSTFPEELTQLKNLEHLNLAFNYLSSSLPEGTDDYGGGYQWSHLRNLKDLDLTNNDLTGSIRAQFVLGVASKLTSLKLGYNYFTGTLPPELGRMKHLVTLAAPSNSFEGTLPFELGRLFALQEFNLTSNFFQGNVPRGLCESNSNPNIEWFGCDAILCPPGFFHPNGAADESGGCRSCPDSPTDDMYDPSPRNILGRTTCDDADFLVGDVNGDGVVSPREILRLLFSQNGGIHWGETYRRWWPYMDVAECSLPGVTCADGVVAKIDLSDAQVCADLPPEECHGIPAEISLLSDLEVLSLKGRQHLQGTIPSELGLLPKLKYLDYSYCPQMRGTIPTELGLLSNLKILNLANSQFTGTMPSELFSLPRLEKLHLSVNPIEGSIPMELGDAKNLKELMLSRLLLTGTIPFSVGMLSNVENIELYGNNLHGTIPTELARCLNLKRIDAFNNKLSGSLPTLLANISALQILHLKKNKLTGTLPWQFGQLEHLSWVDISFNTLSGSIPTSFGQLRNLKDFKLGGNRLHDPIPQSLCSNNKINDGKARSFGCDSILCPLGFYDSTGFAYDADEGCRRCPKGKTTMYLGSTECVQLHLEDLLSLFYDVMGGEGWDQNEVFRWKSDLSICHWNGIICEDDNTLVSVSFPLERVSNNLGERYDDLNEREVNYQRLYGLASI